MNSGASLAAANLAIDKVQQLQQFHVILCINYTTTTNIVLRGTKLNGNAIFIENVTEMASLQDFCEYLFRPLLRGGGGGNYILKWVFLLSILADRYIHRRELRLVSLKSLSSVEYGIKTIFFIFVFYRELSRFKLLRK